MDHLTLNGLAFAGFFGIAITHHVVVHRRHPEAGETMRHLIFSGICTPACIDACRDFLIHFVVYSGLVIPTH